MEAFFLILVLFIFMVFLFCWGVYDDLIARAVTAYEVRKGWNSEAKPPVFLQILVWLRLKMM